VAAIQKTRDGWNELQPRITAAESAVNDSMPTVDLVQTLGWFSPIIATAIVRNAAGLHRMPGCDIAIVVKM
jgi:hypothetical protein